ncbi:MAG: hypothetical protein WCJ41_20525 [Aestuariivirga sp.]
MRIHEITDSFKLQSDAITKQQKDLKIKKARIRATKAQAALRKAQQP